MTKRFSASANKLSAIASHLLGWSPDQFWAATPQELVTIFDAASNLDGENVLPLDAVQLHKLKDKFPDG